MSDDKKYTDIDEIDDTELEEIEEGNQIVEHTLKTISGSEDSNLKLSAYNKKKVKITGILNTETNEITLTTYKLAGE